MIRKRRDRLQVAIIANQLATPGLGSWMAGHRIAGGGQLVLAVTGFVLYVVYFVRLMGNLVATAGRGNGADAPPSWLWQSALVLFGVAWLWAGVTSVQMAVELWRRRGRESDEDSAPPRLDAS